MNESLRTRVQLFISGRGLKNKDTFSKSDPFCAVLLSDPQAKRYIEVGRTETLQNNLNPDWVTAVTVEYYFEIQQHIKFAVYDYDGPHKHESLGTAENTLGQVVGKGTMILDLKGSSGKLIVRAEELKDCNDMVFLSLRAHHVDKKDTFGKSDPYLVFHRQRADGQWLRVFKTEEIRNTLDPVWKPIEVTAQLLCNGDFSRPILVECWDWDRNSSDDYIGCCQTTLAELLTPQCRKELINAKLLVKKKKYTNSGVLEVQHAFSKKVFSFIDYLRGGTSFRMIVAIDFTGSNGHPKYPDSLHYLQSNAQNEYERAIWAVGEILENYDSIKSYPVLGFGGKFFGNSTAHHCFPLTGNMQDPFVRGVAGILQVYHHALASVELAGPTLFQHILQNAIFLAQQSPPGLQYNVLLILTDGEIHDMPASKSLIIDASHLPLSIIIVGLGNDNFLSMQELDSDRELLRDHSGRKAARDIVQFVPFRQFERDPYLLAREVLAEVPLQVTQFMKSIGHEPALQQLTPMQNLMNIPAEARGLLTPFVQDKLPPHN